MGDKIRRRRPRARSASLACPAPTRHHHRRAGLQGCRGNGLPVLVKAAAGGGGRGMKVAFARGNVRRALDRAVGGESRLRRRRALHGKYLRQPRHVEMQIIAVRLAMSRIWASATVRCSAATRKCWRNALACPQRRTAPEDRRHRAQRHRQARLSRRRHDRVSL